MKYYQNVKYNLDFPVDAVRDDGSKVDFTAEVVSAGFAPLDTDTDATPIDLKQVTVVLGLEQPERLQYIRATIGPGTDFPLARGVYQSYVQPFEGGPVFEAGAIEVY